MPAPKQSSAIPVHRYQGNPLPFEVGILDKRSAAKGMKSGREPHRHNYYEVFVFYEGGGEHDIDFKTYPIETASAHFITPGQVHLLTRMDNCHGAVITFAAELFSIHGNDDLLRRMQLYHNPTLAPVVQVPQEAMASLKHTVSVLLHEQQNPGSFTAELACSMITSMLISCNRLLLEARHHSPKPAENAGTLLLRRFSTLLDEHFIDVRDVDAYAALLSISTGHLSKVIRSLTGVSISGHIQQRILLEARRLLLNTDISVKEISYQLNFEDPAYFGRFFRKHTGVSPAMFRETMREKYQI